MTQQQLSVQSLAPIWTTTVETMQALVPFFEEQIVAFQRQAPPHWYFLVVAAAGEPDPLTVDQLQALYPYNERQALQDALLPLVEGDYLQPDGANGSGGYRVTEKGRALFQRFYDPVQEALREVTPLPAAELAQLRDLLQMVAQNIHSPQPARHSQYHVGRLADPGPDGSLAAQIDQYITDLYYYRDDAHIAAWRPTGLSGPAWETLTFLWRDQAHSAAELDERLANRNQPEGAYAAALEQLAARGLVTLDGDQAQITPKGRRLREEAEDRTDEIFFVPWQALSLDQHDRLHRLLQQARDNLNAAARIRMWPLMYNTAAAMQPLVTSDVGPVLNEKVQPPALFLHLRMAREAEPAAYTVQRNLTRNPYVNPQRAVGLLQQGIEAGFVQQDGDKYRLTAQGQEAVDAVNDAFYAVLAKIEVLPEAQMDRLNELLRRLVEGALHSGAPTTERLRQTYDTARPRDYAPLARVDLNIDDLNAFRDDAHTSAWAGNYAGGRDWEAFTLVWQGAAGDAAELTSQLAYRGWEEADFQKSLDALVQRGWLQVDDGRYGVTAEGQALRQRVEDETDKLFYAHWDDTLSPDEQTELRTLLIQLKDKLEVAKEVQDQSA